MLVIDDEVEEDPDELPDDEELTTGGSFDDFPFDLDTEDPASFSCDEDVDNEPRVLRLSFGDVCGLWIFSPLVSVKLLLSFWSDDSSRLNSLS